MTSLPEFQWPSLLSQPSVFLRYPPHCKADFIINLLLTSRTCFLSLIKIYFLQIHYSWFHIKIIQPYYIYLLNTNNSTWLKAGQTFEKEKSTTPRWYLEIMISQIPWFNSHNSTISLRSIPMIERRSPLNWKRRHSSLRVGTWK